MAITTEAPPPMTTIAGVFTILRKNTESTPNGTLCLACLYRLASVETTTEVKEPFVELLATDTQVVEAYGVGAIQNWVDANGGVLPYTTIRIDATLDEVLLSLKRFEFVLKNSHIERVIYQRASE